MIGVHFRDNRQAIGEVRAALDLGAGRTVRNLSGAALR